MLDHQRLWPGRQDLCRCAQQIVITGQHLGLAIVDQQRIEPRQYPVKVLAMVVDPVIHGVAANHLHVGHLPPHICLKDRIDVRQKEKIAVCIRGRNLGRKCFKDVQFCLQRLGFVEVLEI